MSNPYWRSTQLFTDIHSAGGGGAAYLKVLPRGEGEEGQLPLLVSPRRTQVRVPEEHARLDARVQVEGNVLRPAVAEVHRETGGGSKRNSIRPMLLSRWVGFITHFFNMAVCRYQVIFLRSLMQQKLLYICTMKKWIDLNLLAYLWGYMLTCPLIVMCCPGFSPFSILPL